jgi:hypothetical protein
MLLSGCQPAVGWIRLWQSLRQENETMSTRSQVIIKDAHSEQWFYRHSDGYPEGNMPILQKYINWVRDGKIRNSVGQGAGWLVLLGAIEYQTLSPMCFPQADLDSWKRDNKMVADALEAYNPPDWKVGAYEPESPGRHGDIEFLYIIDLDEKTVMGYSVRFDDEDGKGDKLVCSDTAEIPWKA